MARSSEPHTYVGVGHAERMHEAGMLKQEVCAKTNMFGALRVTIYTP